MKGNSQFDDSIIQNYTTGLCSNVTGAIFVSKEKNGDTNKIF